MRPNTTAVAAMKNRVNFPKVRLEELRVFAEERAMSAPDSDHVVCGFVASGGEGEVRRRRETGRLGPVPTDKHPVATIAIGQAHTLHHDRMRPFCWGRIIISDL